MFGVNEHILKQGANLISMAGPITDINYATHPDFTDYDIDQEDTEQLPHLYIYQPKNKKLIRYPAAFNEKYVFRPEMVFQWFEYHSFKLENEGKKVLRTASGKYWDLGISSGSAELSQVQSSSYNPSSGRRRNLSYNNDYVNASGKLQASSQSADVMRYEEL